MKKILVVDDDKDLVLGLIIRLRASGFEVINARDAIMAVIMAKKEKPDLMILDIGLPGGDGFMVMERLMNLSSFFPIIVLSARDPEGNKERALKAGAVAYFQKPAENSELIDCIKKTLGIEG